jgi:hypothetical protein
MEDWRVGVLEYCRLVTRYCFFLLTVYCLLLAILYVGNRRHFLASLFPQPA